MKTKEAYKDFWWGANAQHFPEEECIIKVSKPKVLIRYLSQDDVYEEEQDFYDDIVEIRWLDETPDETTRNAILKGAWTFLKIEEEMMLDEIGEEDE